MRRRLAGLTIVLACLLGGSWTIARVASTQSQPAGASAGATVGAATTSAPAGRRVLIISVDGLRPDMALRADMPTVRGLLRHGAFTFWARTTAVAITLPSHTSMLTGVTPEKHGITWNDDQPHSGLAYPRVPTLFELAHKAGFTTAMAAGKSKFSTLARPGTLDWTFVPGTAESKVTDQTVADHAVAMIHEHKPQVLFVHLPDVDSAGHKYGWGSDEQVKAIQNADAQIRRVLEALDQERLREQTLVIVTADHGGAGLSHGAGDERSRNIPWIAVGPGVRENFDLTLCPKLEVHTEDSFATACWFLNIPLADGLDGKMVSEILQPARIPGRHE